MQREIRTYFELEAAELVDRLTRGVAQLDAVAAPPDNVRTLERAAHTLKGAAHVVGETGIADLAHQFEDVLAEYRRQPREADAERLLHLTDRLAEALATARETARETAAHETAAHETAAHETGRTSITAPPSPPQPQAEWRPPPARSPASPPAAGLATAGLPALATPAPGTPAATVRIDREETGRLLAQVNVAGGLVASARDSLRGLAQIESDLLAGTGRAGGPQRLRAIRGELEDQLDRLDRQMIELHRSTSRLSLVSTQVLLLEAGRIVRASATAAGREVACVTHGGGERVDLHIVEALQGALLHLVRNAVAHGIESASERRAAGKPVRATITVSVERRGGAIVLTCADDGCGIALEPIRAAAVERGFLSPTQAAQAAPADLLRLLLRPGFSTRRTADHMAGRGVGLDAVQEAASRLQGEVSIQSEPGRGTTFTVSAPRTLLALTILEVTAGGLRYGLPVDKVEQTFRVEAHHKVTGQGSPTVLVDRQPMPYLLLQDLMPAPVSTPRAHLDSSSDRRASSTCVVVRSAAGPLALGVDRVEATNEVLVQPLPAIAGAAAYIAGAALERSGDSFLVLNPDALSAALANGTARPPGGTARPPGGRRDPASALAPAPLQSPGPILVVDDSLTTRMLEQSILEGEGYQVDLAVSAEQGLEMARQRRYALFLVDVEMPGMSGYDFVRQTRADDHLSSIPSILVTSLDSPEDRARGRAAGAVSYIVKGEFNQQVYLDRIRSVMRSGQ